MEPIVDSALTREEALSGTRAPEEIRATLALVSIPYRSFDGHLHQGQLLIHQDLVEEVRDIFRDLLALSFPIAKVIPLSRYGWDDEASMQDNNSSAFNYRTIACTDRLSNHARGLAIDINPLLNPYTQHDGKIVPEGARHDPSVPGTLVAGSPAVEVFTQRGWDWGGLWTDAPDFQHFAKAPR